eukprot:scaffold322530_cov22-Tisochrysis_lutea.AAC.1
MMPTLRYIARSTSRLVAVWAMRTPDTRASPRADNDESWRPCTSRGARRRPMLLSLSLARSERG